MRVQGVRHSLSAPLEGSPTHLSRARYGHSVRHNRLQVDAFARRLVRDPLELLCAARLRGGAHLASGGQLAARPT